jgi:hypothetical protein
MRREWLFFGLAAAFGVGILLTGGLSPAPPPAPAPVPSPAPSPPAPAPVGKKTLYFFTESGCRACRQMDRVLDERAVTAQLARFLLVRLPASSPPTFIAPITSVPLFVIATGSAGPELSRKSGYMDATAFAAWLAAN